jgi:hypothetical protein
MSFAGLVGRLRCSCELELEPDAWIRSRLGSDQSRELPELKRQVCRSSRIQFQRPPSSCPVLLCPVLRTRTPFADMRAQ